MANIKLDFAAEPFSGQIVSFTAPCSCDAVTEGLIINGEIYTVCDGMGNCVTGMGGYWCEGAVVSVTLDVENKKAYLQNTTSNASNKSLLDNWYFVAPSNQRGQTEYTGAGYGIDRWKIDSNAATLVIEETFVKVSAFGGAVSMLRQNLEGKKVTAGQSVTFSVLYKNLVVSEDATLSLQINFNGIGQNSEFVTESDGVLTASFVAQVDGEISNVNVIKRGTSGDLSVNLLAAKLELGDKQTLAHQDAEGNWVLSDPPPNKDLELLKCCMSTADSSDTYANNKRTSAAVNAVNKAGDTMTGNFAIERGSGSSTMLLQHGATEVHSYSDLYHKDKNGAWVRLRLQTIDSANGEIALGLVLSFLYKAAADSTHSTYALYGTHNITKGTSAMSANSSPLATNSIYLQYE